LLKLLKRLTAAGAGRVALQDIPSDDPEPVGHQHWEIFGFSTATQIQGDAAGVLAGVEVDYGAAPNLQIHMIAPLAFDIPDGGDTQIGIGDVEWAPNTA
jgi:hypothetical protein